MSRRSAVTWLAALIAACGSTRQRDDAGTGDPHGGGQGSGGGTGDDGRYTLRQSPIAIENQLPGSRGWQCALYNPALNGYPDRTSYLPGDQVAIRAAFVSRPTNATWQLWRMGYYGGALGRKVASGGPATIAAQPPNVVDPATGAVSAPWPVAFTFTIPSGAVTGIYVVKLSAPEGDTLIPLVVRESTPGAVILYPVSTNTYQAYNTWGGTSLYVNQIRWSPSGSRSRSRRTSVTSITARPAVAPPSRY